MAKTILVVDDSEIARLEVVQALRQAGYGTEEADSGERALQIVREGKVAAVITDVHMPIMNGIELCEAIAASSAHKPPILVVSTEANPTLKARAKAAGVKGWIIKPVDTEALVEVLSSLA